ncbi:ATP-grasp fold amidoligase family protein [Rhodohalobacter barkolensis]|uniref:Glycosyl transferase n=1 Tax=Rhodohalobacter barkolensis TaxID=2053187 RepID=A0A2N0VGH8_9BACT|nr:ATP-grasp fold amidoligase family protein [Rhodohalobacter barkolensis]PKD43279.1 glycosyl transferase [Rhodohalobacter barkolensis]
MKQYIKRITEALKCRVLPPRLFIRSIYRKRTGKKLNLSSPKTFSEKIQWLKLYYKNPLLTRMADKAESKKIVKERVGPEYVIPSFKVYNRADDINHSELPEQFALKATHGSGWNIIETSKESISEKEIRDYFRYWLKKSYYIGSKEWAYKHIQPRVVCEELIFNADGTLPEDYKFFCFNGTPTYVQVDHGRFEKHTRSFYDAEWNKMPFSIGYPLEETVAEKPRNLEKMFEIAAVLSEELPFLRVDMYNVNGKIYIGELTCYPGNGLERFSEERWDHILGEKLNLDK